MFTSVLRAALVFLLLLGTSARAFAAAPAATTTPATSITTSSAVLNGTGTPNGEATTGWFRIATASPGTCNDTFGTRIPATSGTDLGSGAVAVPYGILATGLTSGVTYYYCAIVANGSGTAYGTVQTFTVPGAPVTTTLAATSVTSTGATLEGEANPVAASATGWFRYATTSPGTCNDTFGTRAPTSGGTGLGAGNTPVAYNRAITGLLPGTTYYYCAIASNTHGTTFGAVLSLTTPGTTPTVTTSSATSITGATATLNGSGVPRGDATIGYFRYSPASPGSCNDTFGTRVPATGGTALGSGNSSVPFTQPITGLTPSTTYYFCAIANNSFGTAVGTLLSFTTPNAPIVTTSAATGVTSTGATLNGIANPNLATTTAYFRYAATDPGTCNDTFGSRAPTSGGASLSGSSSQSFAQTISGLSSGATYYYCAIATNSEGTSFGAVLNFRTPGPPNVTTSAATGITSSGATLEGAADPNGATTTGWFRYATTSPGTCNDTFGTRAPTGTGGSSLGMGTTDVAYTRAITGLTPSTTYYYCAIASNTYGTRFGAVMSFTTPSTAPTVSTGSATMLTGTTALLNGSGNPGGDSTTAWFRYATVSPGTCNDTFGTRAPASGGSGLGAGITSVAFSQPISGLVPGTTYYYCALASNSGGTAVGSVQSFVTPSAPTAITSAASGIASTSATLNGQGDPNGATTSGYFRYSTTSPGTCNDTFGSRAPTSGGTNLGSGTSNVAFNQLITGLSPATTYYFCAIASSAEGTGFGAVMSFTTLASPTVTTAAATLVVPTSATLNGLVNPNGAASTGWFRYATTSPGTCNDTFGTRAPTTGAAASFAAGTSDVAYSRSITGLTPATTYYFCAIANNTYGTSYGAVLSFTTPASPPTASTSSASLLTGTTARLNGSSNPGGDATTGWFRYATTSPGSCNDTFGTRAPASGGSALGAGTTSVSFNQDVAGLTPGTTYYFCAIAQSSVGIAYGSVLSFTTPMTPTVTTTAATAITNAGATLNGAADPNGSSTTGYFRYSATDPGSCNDTFGSRAPTSGGSALGSGTTSTPYSAMITGLSAGTTYYFCAIATSAEGTAFGAVLTFRTLAPPTVTTTAATLVTSSSATLNGLVNPEGAASTGWFRYATTSPGTCNDTFGTRAPTSGTTSFAAGTSDVAYSRAITGLTPSTTYYFCAIANNTHGTRFGAVLSFTTPSTAPTVSTGSATLLTGTTAQLNGSGNPGGDATTAWFRYSTVSPGTCNDTFGTRAPASGGSALGAGTSSVAFSQPISGLTPSTTYYYCALASNSGGTVVGSVQSFVTPSPPTAITSAASGVTNNVATLNGQGDPNGSVTTGYFRYSTTDPGTCNDTFGSRAPTSGGTNLGSGTTNVAFSAMVSGLSPNTTYYFCAIATSSEGTGFGSVLSFTTLAAPTVTTSAATLVTSTSATLNGSADPNGATATGWYRYSTTSPGTCNDTFGTRAPASSGTSLGAGTADVPFPRSITGLTPATTYYFCAIASNTYGTSYGAVLSFTTPSTAPTVNTSSASLLTGTTARLNGSGNPGGDATTAWFRYATVSPGSCNDTFGTRAPATGGSALGAGTTSVSFSQDVTGLTPGTTYYYCAIASNGGGTVYGSIVSFTTPSAPTVITSAATAIASTGATLNGSGNPNRASTTGYFRYATTDPGACNDTFGSRAPTSGGSSLGSGTTSQAFSWAITGLSPGTTYYYCAIATSSEGTAFGAVLTFTTLAAPTVTTTAATLVTSTSATLNGTASGNGDATTAWFRYATTSPGTCNDTFGTRAPTSGGSSIGASAIDAPFSRALTGLTPGTTYYYCAIAQNAVGTRFGAVMSFTSLAAPPTVTTSAASGITTTSATLNGSANPNGASTTGWFRIDTVSPGTCNDTFGTRVPSSAGSALGGGTAAVAYSQLASALTPGTTYYYCAIASSSEGTSFGTVRTLVTTAPPTVATLAATPVTSVSATLNGSGNPNGYTTTGWFRWSTTHPGACSDSFGTRTPASGGTALGAGTTPVAYSQALTGLSPGTTYYFCAIASSSIGTSLGEILSFTTPAAGPTVTTVAASGIGPTSASLNGSANPNGSATTGWFRWSTTHPGACNDTFGTRTPASGGTALGAGNTPVAYSASISGLTLGTTYYYCAIASNGLATSVGAVLSFTTSVAPTVTTQAASAVAASTATLNGSATPNGTASTGWFRYSTTNPGACNDTFGTRAPASSGTALGAGTSAVAYSQALTGLTAGTTYYYCAIAQSSAGTGFGAVLSFTTTAPPSVTTDPASAIASTSATLNGTGTPNLAATTGYFRYATTSPGTCNDTFGTRAPASAGAMLGSGTSPVAFSQAISGLAPATTYHYCAIATSSAGTSFGALLSFTTPAAPAVTTAAPIGITSTTATLNGTATPNLSAATGWFRYATTSPGACNDTFGTRAPASGGTSLGAGSSPVAYSQALTGLVPGATYYYCAIASNAAGTGFGSVMSFTTPAAPMVTTTAATALSSTGATLNGTVGPNGVATTGWFRYATTSPGACNDTFGTATGGVALGAGTTTVPHSAVLTGLTPGATYYYCAIASNSVGTSFGSVMSFSTSSPPTVTTTAATAVAASSATINGTASPNGLATTGWLRFSTADPGACNDTFGTRAPASGGTALGAGSTAVAFSQSLTGLVPGTTYYYCAIASSSAGTSFGAVLSFSTSEAPAVTTSAASAVSHSAATLNGSGIPNGSASTGWFRYATTDPGACNDSFGTRAPATGGTSLGAGTTGVSFSQALTGLLPSTTYYFCAIASNAAGTGFGAVMSFTTSAAPIAPTVTTEAASAVAGTSATLNGTANPNGTASTGWFRFATTDPGACSDSFGTRAPATGGTSLGAGSTAAPFSQALTGLVAGTTYYYCAIASSSIGTSFGSVMSFTTPAPPVVTTEPATALSSTGATLNGTASPNGTAATGWFRYATTSPGTCNDTFGTRAPAVVSYALGAGTTAVPFSQSLAGLTEGTTYYYCAIAQNASGTSFGAVVSFTTTVGASAPAVTTEAATAVTSRTATLNGTASPNLAATTAWFRWSATDPGACDDAFGTRAPSSGGTSVGAGSAAVPFSEAIAGLTPGATYYYCAIAQNASGTRFGTVMTFTTEAEPPIVTTTAPTDVMGDSAVLNGSARPNGDAATGWFRWSTTDPVTCDDSFGTRAPATGGLVLGDVDLDVPFSEMITGLVAGTTYYYCAIAENGAGQGFGEVLTFVPGAEPPVVTTEPAIEVLATSATIAGTANPNGTDATGWFRYGDFDPGACDDAFGTRAPATGGAMLGAGVDAVPFDEMLSGLEPSTTYYYCAAASNAGGATFGEVRTFTTEAAPPVVRTVTPTVLPMGAVTLSGAADPNGSETTGWFRYAATDPGACDDSFGSRAPSAGGTMLGAGRAEVPFTQGVALLPGTYYVCAIASNEAGVAFGEVMTFEVPDDGGGSVSGGCGCRVGSRASGSGGALVMLALAALIAARRRRRRH